MRRNIFHMAEKSRHRSPVSVAWNRTGGACHAPNASRARGPAASDDRPPQLLRERPIPPLVPPPPGVLGRAAVAERRRAPGQLGPKRARAPLLLHPSPRLQFLKKRKGHRRGHKDRRCRASVV